MAISITYDLRGSQFRWPSSNSASWSRRYHATGIAAGTIAEQFFELMSALPSNGSKAPNPWNLICIDRTIDELVGEVDAAGAPLTTAQAFGTVIYQFPTQTANDAPATTNDGDGTSYSITSFTEQVEITKNADGSRITVEDSDGKLRGRSIFVPMSRARIAFRRKEKDFPRARIDTFTNAVNTSPWNGYPAGTVRVEDISVDTIDSGQNYLVDYVFIQRQEGWNAIELVGSDVDTGEPIANPSGSQVALYFPYASANFASLEIDLPS